MVDVVVVVVVGCRENLRLNQGGYYPKMRSKPEVYLKPCSVAVKEWLAALRQRQVTYVVSGSDPEYVDHVATFCLGRDWRQYFDFIVCGAKKPSFFTGSRPFQRHGSQVSGTGQLRGAAARWQLGAIHRPFPSFLGWDPCSRSMLTMDEASFSLFQLHRSDEVQMRFR